MLFKLEEVGWMKKEDRKRFHTFLDLLLDSCKSPNEQYSMWRCKKCDAHIVVDWDKKVFRCYKCDKIEEEES